MTIPQELGLTRDDIRYIKKLGKELEDKRHITYTVLYDNIEESFDEREKALKFLKSNNKSLYDQDVFLREDRKAMPKEIEELIITLSKSL